MQIRWCKKIVGHTLFGVSGFQPCAIKNGNKKFHSNGILIPAIAIKRINFTIGLLASFKACPMPQSCSLFNATAPLTILNTT